MKKEICSLLLLFAIHVFSTAGTQDERDPALLIGRINVRLLQSSPQFGWFNANYSKYKTNSSAIYQLSKISTDLSFIAFGGTWSEATQNILPQFYKVLDEAKINRNRVVLYFLDRDRKSPQGYEAQYGITGLPTLIFLKNGQELGRINGSVNTSVEGDLADLLVR